MNSASKYSKRVLNSNTEQPQHDELNIRTTLENLHIGVMVHSTDSRILFSNPAARQILGLTEEQINEKQAINRLCKFIYEDLTPMAVEDYPVNRVILSQKPLTNYLMGMLKSTDNNITWIVINVLPIFSKEGVFENIIVNISDVSERMQSRDAIKKDRKLLSTITKHLPNTQISVVETDFSISYSSGQKFTNQHLSPSDFIGLTVDQIFGYKATFIKDQYKKSFNGEHLSFQLFFEGLDLLYRTVPLIEENNSIQRILVVTENITEKILVDKTSQSNKNLLRNIFENTTNLYYSHSPDHTVTYLSPQAKKMLGFTVGAAKTQWMEIISDNPINQIGFNNTEKAIKTGKRQPPYELELIRKDGKKIWVEVREFPEVQNGKTIAIQGSLTEITERKQAENAIKESEEKFRNIFENRGTATGLFGEDGIAQDCNAVFCELSGYPRKEIINNMIWSDFIASDDLEKLQKYHTERVKSGVYPPSQYECKIITKSKGLLDVIINITVLGKTRIVSIIDITEQKKANLEIQRMQRLEELGTIAGGIAHDFNNLLTGVFANIEMAKLNLSNNSSSADHLQKAGNCIISARRLAGQLLSFAKGGASSFKTVDTAKIIHQTIEFNLHGSSVKTQITIQNDLWSLIADEGQIEQVLANLTINSKQAMPHGGTLYVDCKNLSVCDGDHKSNSIQLTIRDEGTGIPAKVIDRIFNPYFSTKETGQGLGLAIVYNIVKSHKGRITVSSKPDIGTTFTIILPASPKAVKEKTQVTDIINSNITIDTSLHILIMDDEQIIRDVGSQLLNYLGHTTDTANHGDEAVKKYTEAQNTKKPFDLVIMDLTIRGGKGGRETIKELLSIHPNAKVIVSSGYSSNPIMANFSSYGFAGKLAKPFEVSDLQDVILSVMNS